MGAGRSTRRSIRPQCQSDEHDAGSSNSARRSEQSRLRPEESSKSLGRTCPSSFNQRRIVSLFHHSPRLPLDHGGAARINIGVPPSAPQHSAAICAPVVIARSRVDATSARRPPRRKPCRREGGAVPGGWSYIGVSQFPGGREQHRGVTTSEPVIRRSRPAAAP